MIKLLGAWYQTGLNASAIATGAVTSSKNQYISSNVSLVVNNANSHLSNIFSWAITRNASFSINRMVLWAYSWFSEEIGYILRCIQIRQDTRLAPSMCQGPECQPDPVPYVPASQRLQIKPVVAPAGHIPCFRSWLIARVMRQSTWYIQSTRVQLRSQIHLTLDSDLILSHRFQHDTGCNWW